MNTNRCPRLGSNLSLWDQQRCALTTTTFVTRGFYNALRSSSLRVSILLTSSSNSSRTRPRSSSLLPLTPPPPFSALPSYSTFLSSCVWSFHKLQRCILCRLCKLFTASNQNHFLQNLMQIIRIHHRYWITPVQNRRFNPREIGLTVFRARFFLNT